MMFLGKKVDTKLYLNLNGKIIPEDELVKLLGVTIDSNLNFNSCIKEICGKVNQKTSAFSRLRHYISEKKAKLLLNTVVMPNFQYCFLIWLFCSKAANDLIHRTTKRAMRITYNSDNEETLEALLQRGETLTVHRKNLQKVMVEIYKTINHKTYFTKFPSNCPHDIATLHYLYQCKTHLRLDGNYAVFFAVL